MAEEKKEVVEAERLVPANPANGKAAALKKASKDNNDYATCFPKWDLIPPQLNAEDRKKIEAAKAKAKEKKQKLAKK